MSVMMIFSMSGVSVKAAQLQENNELKTVMVDMKDVATGDASQSGNNELGKSPRGEFLLRIQ